MGASAKPLFQQHTFHPTTTNKHNISLSKVKKNAFHEEVVLHKQLGLNTAAAAILLWTKEHFLSQPSLDERLLRAPFKTVQVSLHLMASFQRKRAKDKYAWPPWASTLWLGGPPFKQTQTCQWRNNSRVGMKPTNGTFRTSWWSRCTDAEFLGRSALRL